MNLTYRGQRYAAVNNVAATELQEISGHYRGVKVYFSQPQPLSSADPSVRLSYRGINYRR
ncbi:MAG TPA: DUF4278 domain-containing protein [Leptolyngbyaceae cyanobacterium M33_DOE_097]|uniref:DUF4278 domain-containing protein n=1 Tax=Oscillatoriales cyanobacterium SpSt-418 TaxID=2282169 RepID=A0A7C3PR65_9CYAN|nr:DUF4278 domain-containing protein [Leptolyngbyaceae cyanobacterium M33_DOE_097]